MITLYTFGPGFGLRDLSPFVRKAQLLLKMSGQPFQEDRTGFRKAPKGKLPYIDDAGEIIADSQFIRWHLERKYAIDFDAGLTPTQRAANWALEKMLENHSYFFGVSENWLQNPDWAKGILASAGVPGLLLGPLSRLVRGQVAKSLKAQGSGRHSREQLLRLQARDIEVVAQLLGDKPFFGGDQPCGLDATASAFVDGWLCKALGLPSGEEARKYPTLSAYQARMQQRFFAP